MFKKASKEAFKEAFKEDFKEAFKEDFKEAFKEAFNEPSQHSFPTSKFGKAQKIQFKHLQSFPDLPQHFPSTPFQTHEHLPPL
jgi:hypothetical protein